MNKRAIYLVNKVALVVILTSFVSIRASIEEGLFLKNKENFCRQYASLKQFLSDCIDDPFNNKKVDRLIANKQALETELRTLEIKEDDIVTTEPAARSFTEQAKSIGVIVITGAISFLAIEAITKQGK